jgi:hypothetical protein
MYSSANEDGGKYNPADPEYNEQKREDKKRKAEEKKAKRAKVKHIKIRASQGLSGEESPSPLDDGNKRDDEREIGLQGGPAGSRGTLLDLATGAKSGTGSAMSPGLPIAMSEPMEGAWSTLLKASLEDLVQERDRLLQSGLRQEAKQFDHVIQQMMRPDRQEQQMLQNIGVPTAKLVMPELEGDELEDIGREIMYDGRQNPDYIEMQRRMGGYDPQTRQEFMRNVSRMSRRMPKIDEAREQAQQSLQNLQAADPSRYFADQEVMTGEPMKDAWSSLLKQDPHVHDVGDGSDEDTQRYFDEKVRPEVMNPDTPRPHAMMEHKRLEEKINRMVEGLESYDEDLLNEYNYRMVENDLNAQGSAVSDAGFDYPFQDINTSEPMEDAWSDLLKRETARSIAGRRRREARQQFRPSTGQFKTPPGGMSGGAGATMRRFKAQMRGIKSGKKTGLMKPHLSVEMSHRGIQTKQPLSKDPQKYTQYKGQSEARKILGNVRTPFSPHARYGARSNYAGPTGGGRLSGLMAGQSGQMARPALRRMRRPRMPRMPRMRAPMPPSPPMMPQAQSSVPAMPSPSSSIMMSEERYRSEILKARNSLHRIELLNLMRRLIQAKEREAKIKKNLTATDAADLPGHPAGVKPTDDEDPQGPTENLETDAKTFGLDPVGIINSRRGQM